MSEIDYQRLMMTLSSEEEKLVKDDLHNDLREAMADDRFDHRIFSCNADNGYAAHKICRVGGRRSHLPGYL